MRRGDLVSVALQGAYGKPRPAVVIQSDLFDHLDSVVIAALTGELSDAHLFRVAVNPTEENGLREPSQVMVDKVFAIPRDKVGPVFGRLGEDHLLAVTSALAVFFGIAH